MSKMHSSKKTGPPGLNNGMESFYSVMSQFYNIKPTSHWQMYWTARWKLRQTFLLCNEIENCMDPSATTSNLSRKTSKSVNIRQLNIYKNNFGTSTKKTTAWYHLPIKHFMMELQFFAENAKNIDSQRNGFSFKYRSFSH